MGFDGKTLIHPDQLAIANAVFAPSPRDLALAAEQVAAFEAAEARGEGVAVVDGRIVENLHVATARRLLARAAAITALEGRHDAARSRAGPVDRGHFFKRVAPGARAALDARARRTGRRRGVVAALIGLGLILIVVGYRGRRFVRSTTRRPGGSTSTTC